MKDTILIMQDRHSHGDRGNDLYVFESVFYCAEPDLIPRRLQRCVPALASLTKARLSDTFFHVSNEALQMQVKTRPPLIGGEVKENLLNLRCWVVPLGCCSSENR